MDMECISHKKEEHSKRRIDDKGAWRVRDSVRERSTLSDISSDISPSPLYIPPHHR